MTTSRPQPLFYQSSKCVALYLEANIRFQLSQRCPEFRTVHQTATLKIPDLKMRPNDFEINGTTFTLGVIQKYTTTPTPESVKLLNASGGIQYDVDRYGLSVEDSHIVSKLNDSTLQEGLFIVNVHACRMRSNNQEPPFTHYLQLTMTTGTVQKVERLEYDKNQKLARDYILGKMFGEAGRRVQIRNLQIGREDFDLQLMLHFQRVANNQNRDIPQKDGPYNAFQMNRCDDQMEPLLPVPEGKLEIEEMRVTGNLKNALASIKTSLSRSNAPLKKIACVYQPLPDDPVVQNAEFLCVAGIGRLKVFSGRENNRIHLAECDVMPRDFTDLLNICTKVGQFYSIGFQHQTTVEEFFEMFRNLPEAERGGSDESRLSQFPECIIIPMGDETELNVWVERTNEEDKAYCNTKYIVKIKVQNRGHAHAISLF